MTISRSFVDALLSRIDIVDLISTQIPLTKKSKNNYFAHCPFHNEKSPSFSVSAGKQFYYCFGCGAHGNAIDFMMQYDHLSFPDAIENLARQVGMEVPINARQPKNENSLEALYNIHTNAAEFYYKQMRSHSRAIHYLKKRGISGEIAKTFSIGYATANWNQLEQIVKTDKQKQQFLATGLMIKKTEGGYYDRFRDRIIFPIHDYRGRIIGFGGRTIDQGEPKYLNSPETKLFQKGKELYGLYHVLKLQRDIKKVIVVEGYMDVIALFQHGITYAVATLGTATTEAHLKRLLRYTSEIVFCFDGDIAGEKAAWRALEIALSVMHDDLQIRFLFLPDGEDPDSLIRKEGKAAFEQRIINAHPLSTFFFEHLLQCCDMQTLEGRAHFVSRALSHLNQLQEGVFKKFMWAELTKRGRVDLNMLKSKLTQSQQSINKFVQPEYEQIQLPPALKLVLGLLLQYPHLAKLINEPLTELKLPGIALLIQLVEIIKKSPNISTGGLIEHWRGHDEQPLLVTLAKHQFLIPEIGIENEFLGAFRQLLTLGLDEEINCLMSKAANQALNEQEKIKLYAWIGKKKALQALDR